MKIVRLVLALIVAQGIGAEAQLTIDVRSNLSSADPATRESAARKLAAETPAEPDTRTALVALLAQEKGVTKPAWSQGSSAAGGEGYSEYFAWLVGEVMKIADAEPGRADVWNALLAAYPGDGNTAFGKWLGKHGDKVFPYLLAYARDRRTDTLDKQNRIGALTSLAQIAAYERQTQTPHLVVTDLLMAERMIRNGIEDSDVDIRLAAIVALEIMGDPRDLPTLEQIALSDDYVTHKEGQNGPEIHFPLREFAGGAAERMRAKLAAPTGGNAQ